MDLKEQASNIQAGVSNTISGIGDKVSSGLSSLTANADLGTASSEFVNSNSIISKFAFLVLVLIVFIMLMNLGVYIISFFLRPNQSPYVIKGLANGNVSMIIPQDPGNSNSVTIYRSNNEDKGIEFTWTIWLNINELPNGTESAHIFHKGNTSQNGPDVILKRTTEDAVTTEIESNTGMIEIKMDTVTGSGGSVQITNIPLNRWFNVAIRLQNMIMDVYVNGTVSRRYIFQNVPKQNYGDITVGKFNGQLSDLRYFNTALNVFQINNIAMAGPNMTAANAQRDSKFDYLSNIWYKPQA
jgi:hypothetical protein